MATRLTRLFAITTSLLVLIAMAVSAWFISRSTEQSLVSLLREEIDEMQIAYDTLGADSEVLGRAAAEFQRGHGTTPIAWRIWRADGASEWASFGEVLLFSRAKLSTAPSLLGEPQTLPDGLRGLVAEGKGGMLFGCLIDASGALGELRRFGLIGLVLVFATIAIIFGVCHVLVGRVSRNLRQVTESLRGIQTSGGSMQVDLRHAPLEIREIVVALQEMLFSVQGETERNRVFTASLAHELRSPIQNLMGETEVALMAQRDAPEYRRVLVSHLQELRDLADAVDNLVTICSQHKHGQDHSETRESFELGPEARLRLARESSYATARGIRLSQIFEGDTRIYGDREALLRAMRNLTANAIEWGAPDSQVDIHVRGEKGQVVVTVDDSGPGVPEELQERIFEAFFRGPQAKGRRVGYGLGLAIVRSAVDAQGGSIQVGRSPTGGARFTMVLPRNLLNSPGEDTPMPV